jgi:hypothetical protein
MDIAEIVGKIVIVGLSRVNAHGQTIAQTQMHGRILRVSESEGLVIQTVDGSEFHLPPDLSSLRLAPPGEFREASTGETVRNPDLVALWEIHEHPTNPAEVSWVKGPAITFPSGA